MSGTSMHKMYIRIFWVCCCPSVWLTQSPWLESYWLYWTLKQWNKCLYFQIVIVKQQQTTMPILEHKTQARGLQRHFTTNPDCQTENQKIYKVTITLFTSCVHWTMDKVGRHHRRKNQTVGYRRRGPAEQTLKLNWGLTWLTLFDESKWIYSPSRKKYKRVYTIKLT